MTEPQHSLQPKLCIETILPSGMLQALQAGHASPFTCLQLHKLSDQVCRWYLNIAQQAACSSEAEHNACLSGAAEGFDNLLEMKCVVLAHPQPLSGAHALFRPWQL